MTTPQPDPDQPQPAPIPAGAGGAPDVLEVARTLTGALNGLSQRLDEAIKASEAAKEASEARDAELRKYGRRNRLAVGIDILLTIVIALLAWQASNESGRVSSADARAAAATASDMALHAAQVSGCEAGNVERSGELALWTYLFHASTPGTPAQQKAVALFMQQVNRTFAPRDCAKAYALTPPKGASRG